ncbi:MAG: nuclease [Hyphomicrobium sp.]|nr:MAG: nuclease [Hyphomicrobium sp.]
MFGWRKRSEGFEWREYVRTTVLVRRADRQRRIDDARHAALAKVHDVRERGIEAGKAGVDAAAEIAQRAALTVWQRAWAGIVAASRFVFLGLKTAWVGVRTFVVGLFANRERPSFQMPSFEKPSFKFPIFDFRPAIQSLKQRGSGVRFMPDIGPRGWQYAGYAARGGAVLALILVGGQMLGSGAGVDSANTINVTGSILAPPEDLTGRATVLAGDRLRVDGTTIKLSGVIAPDANQPCLKANGRRWACSASAQRALDRLVRGKLVSCNPTASNDAGVTLATCTIGEDDIASTLARGGHVFASTGMFSTYRGDEDVARAAKIGLWQGETVHPDDWRARVWEEAKRTAPDGCPIKGFVKSSTLTYAMPWSRDYSRAKVRSGKADRWFCSEDEARAAGFKISSSS